MKVWILNALILYFAQNVTAYADTQFKLHCKDPETGETFTSPFHETSRGLYALGVQATEGLTGECSIRGSRGGEELEWVPKIPGNQAVTPNRFYPLLGETTRKEFLVNLGKPGRYIFDLSAETRSFRIRYVGN